MYPGYKKRRRRIKLITTLITILTWVYPVDPARFCQNQPDFSRPPPSLVDVSQLQLCPARSSRKLIVIIMLINIYLSINK